MTTELSMMSQMLADEMVERVAERERLIQELAQSKARSTRLEEEARAANDKLATAEAGRLAAEASLESERAARGESERRCTYLIGELGKTDIEPIDYEVEVVGRDGNERLRKLLIKPVPKP